MVMAGCVFQRWPPKSLSRPICYYRILSLPHQEMEYNSLSLDSGKACVSLAKIKYNEAKIKLCGFWGGIIKGNVTPIRSASLQKTSGLVSSLVTLRLPCCEEAQTTHEQRSHEEALGPYEEIPQLIAAPAPPLPLFQLQPPSDCDQSPTASSTLPKFLTHGNHEES